ncbi:class I SAM-dependent methyltransferase [Cellulomonas sp. ACRRI]|uniref:class I SAM-dependent methyltransferase n=1 Tax=Cellulomonas sp. ACRRI TaxID=2918188 RepID=UPI001EF3652B|nr:class I SAM-dependent methyltransferase [Cellulomonas sp. ACRRI]MCG7284771.1 class I SAM-dependent methyltransferase [Cellulomonas sp. ACRRI]
MYCFYSGALLRRVPRLIAGREVLEIAAGDGTLAGFLRERGEDVVATEKLQLDPVD